MNTSYTTGNASHQPDLESGHNIRIGNESPNNMEPPLPQPYQDQQELPQELRGHAWASNTGMSGVPPPHVQTPETKPAPFLYAIVGEGESWKAKMTRIEPQVCTRTGPIHNLTRHGPLTDHVPYDRHAQHHRKETRDMVSVKECVFGRTSSSLVADANFNS